jgi:hypothetical protein
MMEVWPSMVLGRKNLARVLEAGPMGIRCFESFLSGCGVLFAAGVAGETRDTRSDDNLGLMSLKDGSLLSGCRILIPVGVRLGR